MLIDILNCHLKHQPLFWSSSIQVSVIRINMNHTMVHESPRPPDVTAQVLETDSQPSLPNCDAAGGRYKARRRQGNSHSGNARYLLCRIAKHQVGSFS